jgi:hypothetical protein
MICSYQDYNQLKVIQGSLNFLTQNFSLSFAVLKLLLFPFGLYKKLIVPIWILNLSLIFIDFNFVQTHMCIFLQKL